MEPHETETLEAFGRKARGGCFLACPAGFGRGPSGHRAVPWGLTVLMVLRACSSANTEAPFAPGQDYSGAAAIPEAASLGGDVRTAASPDRFAVLMGPACPACAETAWDFHRSVWSAVVPRRDHQSPCRFAAPTRRKMLRGEEGDPSSARLRQAWERGPPTRPKRDPSRVTLAWPLRHRPLPGDAGCVPSPVGGSSKSFRTGTAPHG